MLKEEMLCANCYALVNIYYNADNICPSCGIKKEDGWMKKICKSCGRKKHSKCFDLGLNICMHCMRKHIKINHKVANSELIENVLFGKYMEEI